MKQNKLITAALAAVLALTPIAALAGEATSEAEAFPAGLAPADYLGLPLPDFSVETIDGNTFTFSEELSSKKAVLINLWATWCGPCEREFPYLEEAYEAYQDQVSVIALSTEPEDSPEVLQEYVESHGMTFPVGSDSETNLASYFVTEGIPTTVAIDRFGNVVLIEVGSQSSPDPFVSLFELLISDDYTETTILDGFPPAMPTVEPVSPEELAAAVNGEGVELIWANPEEPTLWPMIPAEVDGRSAITNTNQGRNESEAAAFVTVTVEEGEVFAFDFKTSSETALDLFILSQDGYPRKYFGGEHDWTTYAVSFAEPGAYELCFSYAKDYADAEGEDSVWIANARILSGEEAEEALAANPENAFPYGEEIALTVEAEGAKEIVINGSDEDLALLDSYFNCQSFYIVPTGMAQIAAIIDDSADPEACHFESQYDGSTLAFTEAVDGDVYRFESGIDTVEETGYSYTCVWAALDPSYERMIGIMLFVDEENVNSFIEELAEFDGLALSWEYADGTDASTTDTAKGEAMGTVSYTVTFVDQNGDAVPGCIINFCTDETCVPTIAGEDGIAVFEGYPYEYHLQVIKVPAGYSYDTSKEFYTEDGVYEMEVVVTKD